MLFQFVFISIWVAIIYLAKPIIKKKIKTFFNIKSKSELNIQDKPSDIVIDIEHEYYSLKSILDMNIISIKDELASHSFNKFKKKKKKKKKNPKNKVDKILDTIPDINIPKILMKTIDLMKNLILNIFDRLQDFIKLIFKIKNTQENENFLYDW